MDSENHELWGTEAGSSSSPPEPNRTSHYPLRPSLFSNSTPSILPHHLRSSTERPPLSAPLGNPVPQARPLLTIQRPASSSPPRASRFEDPVSQSLQRSRQIPKVEKDADDPTMSAQQRRSSTQRSNSTTLVTLSRLFAAQVVPSPANSRQPSYNHAAAETLLFKSAALEPGTLQAHLYTRGLLGSRYSDILIHAFGNKYVLHRLILDQAPFFATMFSGPWAESTDKEVTLHPEDIDSNITQTAFELALRRLYGCVSLAEEEAEAIGLFATASWLEMHELVEASTEAILRQMSVATLPSLIKLVTGSYYGRAGDRVLESAKAMLCRDGWKMRLRNWDGIPGDIVREIIGGDGFFIAGEWDRWVLAKRLLDRRLKARAVANGLADSSGKIPKAPDSLSLMAVRFDGVYRKNSFIAGPHASDSHHRWLALYTAPEIEPLLVLLDEGIHYIHLDFEQLQYIRTARDILGLPVMPEKVITNALWMSMELRQRVLNAREKDLELNLSKPAEDDTERSPRSRILSKPSPPTRSKGKQAMGDSRFDDDEEQESGSWDANGKPRKFWIPSTDCNIVMGGNAEPVVTTTQTFQRHASRLSATLQPQDLQWATDFAASAAEQRPMTPTKSTAPDTNPVAYTHFPPFRFAAEFPNPRLLKDKKRVYSRTIFYAGSLWNLYIQKVRSSKAPQLGVYLHRAKEREAEEAITATSLAQRTVDERIGELERSMLLRSERIARREARLAAAAAEEGDTSMSGGDDAEATLVAPPICLSGRTHNFRRIFSPSSRQPKSSQSSGAASTLPTTTGNEAPSGSSLPEHTPRTVDDISHSESNSDDDDEDEELAAATRRFHIAALPPYVDARPQIKTYFKIYSPSKGGRMLAVYESAPDKFNFSQSWGWKSSTLMLDEGIFGQLDAAEGATVGGAAAGGANVGAIGSDPAVDRAEREKEDGEASVGAKARKEGTLRFMVVFGNV
ncbi:MAG: hypothetical protein M1820_003821 [Bogoriella megaspora]|nr:MAG: hypothetical protein M1820_003821 [Bogoriella megaspora]